MQARNIGNLEKMEFGKMEIGNKENLEKSKFNFLIEKLDIRKNDNCGKWKLDNI